jgi:hypothetical protein
MEALWWNPEIRLIHASGLINQPLDSYSSYTRQYDCKFTASYFSRLALITWRHGAETERIFLNVVGAKMRLLRRGDPTRDGVGRTVSAKRREMPSTCPRLQ